jgi:hypothetical protein
MTDNNKIINLVKVISRLKLLRNISCFLCSIILIVLILLMFNYLKNYLTIVILFTISLFFIILLFFLTYKINKYKERLNTLINK